MVARALLPNEARDSEPSSPTAKVARLRLAALSLADRPCLQALANLTARPIPRPVSLEIGGELVGAPRLSATAAGC